MRIAAKLAEKKPMMLATLASAFILWHSLGIIFVGPGPDSDLYRILRPWYEPYLRFFHLDNNWGFYAPNPIHGTFLRYVVRFPDGSREFELSEKFQKHDPAYFRHTLLLKNLRWDSSQTTVYRQSIAQFLCTQHEGARQITLVAYDQTKFTAEDFISGQHPLDPKRLERKTLGNPINCQW